MQMFRAAVAARAAVLVMALATGCASGSGQPPGATPATGAPAATATPAVASSATTHLAPSPEATAETPAPAAPTEAATAGPEPTATTTPAPLPTNPLTGLPLADPAALQRRPLAIKIAHFPRGVRLDQVGLSLADNVWEHYAEGGVTRFTAVFLSEAPQRIGNVRSARLIDTHLGQAYQAILVTSGSSSGVMARMRETDFYDRIIAEYTGYSGCPLLCREEAASVSSNKLFTSAPAVWALAEELGLGHPEDLAGFEFDPEPPAGGQAAEMVHIDFHVNHTVTEWRYSADRRLYERWIDTDRMPELAPHLDAANGQALAAANVVVIFAPYLTSNVHEVEGGRVSFSYDVPLYGSGPALLFRDGRMYELTWQRDPDAGGLPRLVDEAGQPIAYRPGVTWFEVLDPDSPQRFEDGRFYARSRVPGLPEVSE
jgi:hypothetical protein